jgi:hypothetical protein
MQYTTPVYGTEGRRLWVAFKAEVVAAFINFLNVRLKIKNIM